MPNKKGTLRIPKQKRGVETKRQIVSAAMSLFTLKGLHSTTSNEIAAISGLSIGCFYSYFADKHDVFLEALRQYNIQFNTIMHSTLSNALQSNLNKKDFLYKVISGIIEAHSVYGEFYKELFVLRFSNTNVADIMDEQFKYSISIIKEYLIRWQEFLCVSDLETASIVIISAIRSIIETIMFPRQPIDKQALLDNLVDMLYKFLFS